MKHKLIYITLLAALVLSNCSSSNTAFAVGNSPGEGAQEPATTSTTQYSYTIVDTGQVNCYGDNGEVDCPQEGEVGFGQDAQHQGNSPSYQDNGDGTVTDLNTGLMWQQVPDYTKVTWSQAMANAETFDLAGYDDWRMPTIQELYSLAVFTGSGALGIPYIDTEYFGFEYGDDATGTRDHSIDGRYWSSNLYVSTVFGNSEAVFGFNFADGRIKGYGLVNPREQEMVMFVRYVRGNPSYGENDFADNGDGTISDNATGLTWMQNDSGTTYDWFGSLEYCESSDYAGYSDWRLPNAKELHSIVDYSRSPLTSNSAAIDPIFNVSEIESWYWTSTSLLEGRPESLGGSAVYIAFGQAYGLPNGNLIDVHGAGAQRSDPKSGDPANYASGRGTEGQDDQVRIYNYVRCVRDGDTFTTDTGSASSSALSSGNNPQQPSFEGEVSQDGNTQAPAGGLQPPNGGQFPPQVAGLPQEVAPHKK